MAHFFVEERRRDIGGRLREIRQATGWTAGRLANATDISPSRVSRIENGVAAPRVAEVRAFCRAMNIEADETAALVELIEKFDAEYVSMRPLAPRPDASLEDRQHRCARYEEQFEHIQTMQITCVSGLLQTPAYAREIIQHVPWLTERDVSEMLQARLDRQLLLFDPKRTFHFILTESAIRLRYGRVDTIAAQCARLVQIAQLPNVRLGFIPFDAVLPGTPMTNFYIYDHGVVHIDTAYGDVGVNVPRDVALYVDLFERLTQSAEYGENASQRLNDLSLAFAQRAAECEVSPKAPDLGTIDLDSPHIHAS